jgi:hypothetical protein
MKKALLAFVLASTLALFASAEELQSPAELFPQSLGVYGSTSTGGGLSYQRWWGNLGGAVTFGASAAPYSASSGQLNSSPLYLSMGTSASPDFYAWNYNVELDLFYKLYASNFWDWLSGDLFAYALLGNFGGQTASYTTHYAADGTTYLSTSYSANSFKASFAAGIGIGYEITLFKHFSIPLMFGYTAQFPAPYHLDFTGSGGLRYRY